MQGVHVENDDAAAKANQWQEERAWYLGQMDHARRELAEADRVRHDAQVGLDGERQHWRQEKDRLEAEANHRPQQLDERHQRRHEDEQGLFDQHQQMRRSGGNGTNNSSG